MSTPIVDVDAALLAVLSTRRSSQIGEPRLHIPLWREGALPDVAATQLKSGIVPQGVRAEPPSTPPGYRFREQAIQHVVHILGSGCGVEPTSQRAEPFPHQEALLLVTKMLKLRLPPLHYKGIVHGSANAIARCSSCCLLPVGPQHRAHRWKTRAGQRRSTSPRHRRHEPDAHGAAQRGVTGVVPTPREHTPHVGFLPTFLF